jgi:hypothetical protein
MNPRTSHVLYPTKHIGPHHTNNCSAWTHKQMKELQHNLTTKYGIASTKSSLFEIKQEGANSNAQNRINNKKLKELNPTSTKANQTQITTFRISPP